MRFASNSMKIPHKRHYVSFFFLILSLIWSSHAISQAVVEVNAVSVQQGDSLFRIAMENRPDQSVSLQQTMIAIQRLNPNAFVDGNINRVKAGERLLVPSINQIRDIELSDAISSIRYQNQIFRDANSSDLEISGGQDEGQLSILRAEDVASDIPDGLLPVQQENAELERRLMTLENLIAINLEERDRVRLRREELNSRLLQLNAQIDDAKELIRLQDLQLAQLRAQLAETSLSTADEGVSPMKETSDLNEDFLENESSWSRARNDFFGFLQTNSTLVTVAAPLALLLLGWLLWWDRTKYAESRSSGVSEKPHKSHQETDPSVDLGIKVAVADIDSGVVSELTQEQVSREDQELSSTRLDSGNKQRLVGSIDFIGDSSDEDSFADLDFLSDEERKKLDTPEAVEEIFYLGDEESATKLELAYAYVKMNDLEGAREILLEVIEEGNAGQIQEAKKLLGQMDHTA